MIDPLRCAGTDKPQPSFTDGASTTCEMVDKIYTVDEAAEHLRIKPRTLREWIRQGRIKSFKLGDLVRIHEEDLQAFIDQERAKGGEKA